MKKALITSVTAFAIVLNAGASMAGPLGGNGHRGFAPDVRASVSEARSHASGMAHTLQITKGSTDIAVGEQPMALSAAPVQGYAFDYTDTPGTFDVIAGQQPTTLSSAATPAIPLDDTESLLSWLGLVWFNLALVNYPYPANFYDNLPGEPEKKMIIKKTIANHHYNKTH
ncbi:hypothetical protein [uncultured Tateyamaria sp.]|uniref:hypothetical protein n=1 Tax=uncultured Tateyamaria sp. TaxID=455651 RepID=UPI0026168890|nr:hypothetical protein [uncultured Tateyamaria sp.]